MSSDLVSAVGSNVLSGGHSDGLLNQVGPSLHNDAEKRRIADICCNISENLQCYDLQHLVLRLIGRVLPAIFAINPTEKLGVVLAAES